MFTIQTVDTREHINIGINHDSVGFKTPFVYLIKYGDLITGMMLEKDKNYTASWPTLEEARKAATLDLKVSDAYLVLINQDFTEGRGPMKAHKLFRDIKSAHDYIMTQEGIYGSHQYHQVYYGCNIHGGAFVSISYNGYEIRPMNFET